MSNGYQTLTDKEKDTLRLLLRGYDAKTIARHFELSVHTINERLRNVRQKMSVSSSREAARLFAECEGKHPQNSVDIEMRGDAGGGARALMTAPTTAGRAFPSRRLAIAGGIIMSLILAAMLAASLYQNTAPTAVTTAANAPTEMATSDRAPADTELLKAANDWLALVDDYRWTEAYNATAKSFQQLNTLQKWTEVVGKVQPQLGKMLTRNHRSTEFVPAPPLGYQMLKFKSSFERTPDTSETLTLVKEDGKWKVAGYWLD